MNMARSPRPADGNASNDRMPLVPWQSAVSVPIARERQSVWRRELTAFYWIEEFIEISEVSASSAVYSLQAGG